MLGYSGVAAIMLAVRRNEVQGQCGMHLSLLKAQYADLLADGKIKIVVQESTKGAPELSAKSVPLTIPYAKTERERRIMTVLYSQETFAFPHFRGEEPQDRVRALRQAFAATWRDPEVRTCAAKAKLDVSPVSGEEIQALLDRVYSSPPSLLEAARAATKQDRRTGFRKSGGPLPLSTLSFPPFASTSSGLPDIETARCDLNRRRPKDAGH